MSSAEFVALVVFIVVVACVVGLATYPFRFKLPRTACTLEIGYWLPPVVGVLVLLAARALGVEDVKRGIVGDHNMQPFGIAIIFMTLAFMCASLDMTGLFAWLALLLTQWSRGRGQTLFVSYYLLSSVITCFTSNDVVVMTLTPIICYFATAAKTDPIPFLVAEFTAANLWSMMLFIGNPTNIIAAQAYRMSFIEYSKWMALPTIASGAASIVLLHLLHGRHVPPTLHLPAIDSSIALLDPVGAVVGSLLVVACLGLLAAGPSTGWPLWAITLGSALLHCAYTFTTYVLLPLCRRRSTPAQPPTCNAAPCCSKSLEQAPEARCWFKPPEAHCLPGPQVELPPQASGHTATATATAIAIPIHPDHRTPLPASDAAADLAPARDLTTADSTNSSGNGGCSDPPPDPPSQRLQQEAPSFAGLLLKLPWHVVPFVLAMFVLVEALAVAGWVDRLARLLGRACVSTPAALAAVGAVSVAAANLINNQPMTILLTRAVLSDAFLRQVGGRGPLQRTALFAVVIGSNLGALFRPVGSLAGILWADVLGRRGVQVGAARFVRLMAPLGAACTVTALVVLGLETAVF